MTLIVEDGSGLAGAESLCSVAFADAYHAARGNTVWAGLSTTEKEQALRRGTDYMDQAYALRYAGYRKVTTQALSWPRYEVPRRGGFCGEYWSSDSIPVPVANACAELAFRAAKADLAPDIGRVKKSVTVGPITTVYDDTKPAFTQYRQIDQMLAQFFTNTAGQIKMVRG